MKFALFLILFLIEDGFVSGMSESSDASVKFSLDFFRAAYNLNPARNCVLSPIAIQRLLSMLYHAAKLTEPTPLYHLSRAHYENFGKDEFFMDDLNTNALEMISKVYHSQVELNPNLLAVLQAEYSVDVQATDFSRPELVADTVNRWASRFTNGMVGDVLTENGFTESVNLMIINTLTLNASWENQFSPHSVYKSDFHFSNGARKIDMMQRYKNFRYCELKDLRVVELAYQADSDLTMLIIKSDTLPLDTIIDRFDLQTYRDIDEQLYHDRFKLVIPKFSISVVIGAKRILNAMGLSYVFGRNAFEVFAGFSSRLANIYQALRIDIDERGTRAAAGTYSDKSMRVGSNFKFVIDGPFMFVIRKNTTKDIIFIGHYSNNPE
ncbi:leukocyte elastase inhibitor-like [Armigeres subalbatus]|uniref:leukocyte elastase inhibitor-like n=1 Tax=Armigeres subalbatus TaxID=124917 RepID=UPI002ED0AC44